MLMRDMRRAKLIAAVAGAAAVVLGSADAVAGGMAPVVCQSLASLVPCGGFAAHPRTMGLGSDGRTTLVSLKWRHWGAARAIGHGRQRENGAAAGAAPSYTYSPATVTVSHPTSCAGRLAYTTVRITVAGLTSTYRGCVPHVKFS